MGEKIPSIWSLRTEELKRQGERGWSTKGVGWGRGVHSGLTTADTNKLEWEVYGAAERIYKD